MIPIPNEAIEANRIADEASDDALLDDYLAEVARALGTYRGSPVVALFPGITNGGSQYRSYGGFREVRLVDRFRSHVESAVAGHGWVVKNYDDFQLKSTCNITEAVGLQFAAQPDPTPEPKPDPPVELVELPEPLPIERAEEGLIARLIRRLRGDDQ
jgi:hypothetical protein